MIELRPYQREAIAAVAASYRRGRVRPLISLPTGTGKTVIFSSIVQGAEAKGRRSLILTHRDELLTQAEEKLLSVAPELFGKIGVVKAGRDEWQHPVTIASVQSLNERRLERWDGLPVTPRWDVVICDEAHHAVADSYRRFFRWAGSMDGENLTIGVTATPERGDKKDLGAVWEEIVYHRDMLSMIREGYLCNLKGIAVRLAEFDTSKLHVRAGDFIDSEAGEALSAAEAPRHTVAAWMVHASDRKTIVFTPTIALAHEMAMEFSYRGVEAAALSGQTPIEDRREMLRDFNSGSLQVICNAQVLTEGFDEPSVSCIVVAKPTRARAPYIQMVGRGTRIHPGKKDCLIMDVVGVTERLDLTTVPKLFGIDPDKAKAEGDPDGMVDLLVGAAAEDEARREGHLVVHQVELFSRQDLNWQMAEPGVWALNLGDETVIVDVQQTGKWDVTIYPKQQGPRTLKQGLDLGYAMGVAEEYGRRAPAMARALIDKSAKWRQLEPSEGQLDAARKWRIKLPEGVTRGEVNDQLTIKIAAARRKEAMR